VGRKTITQSISPSTWTLTHVSSRIINKDWSIRVCSWSDCFCCRLH